MKYTITISAGVGTSKLFERKEVSGEEVDLGFPYVKAFIHRAQLPYKWTISELETGYSLTSGNTKANTIQKAKGLLANIPQDKYESKIAEVKNYEK